MIPWMQSNFICCLFILGRSWTKERSFESIIQAKFTSDDDNDGDDAALTSSHKIFD